MVFPATDITSLGDGWESHGWIITNIIGPASVKGGSTGLSPFGTTVCVARYIGLESWDSGITCYFGSSSRLFVPTFEGVGGGISGLTVIGGGTVAGRLIGDSCARSIVATSGEAGEGSGVRGAVFGWESSDSV